MVSVLASVGAILVAALVGALLGYFAGRNSTRAEITMLRQASTEMSEVLERDGTAAESRARELQGEITRLTGELATANATLAGEEKKYAQMKADLDSAFRAAAADALRANAESFLTLAKQELGGQRAAADGALAAREQAIKAMVDPLGAALKSLDEQARTMEQQRSGAYAKVEALIDNIQQTIPASLDALKGETSQLIAALRAPKTRGNWGELQLRRCVEYAGMVEYCSFTEQVGARDEEDKLLRPDMTIQLPNGREIVVDAKTPLDAFLDAGNAVDPAIQAARFVAHADRVRTHLKELAGKAYWRQFEKAPDFVVCFLPSEALFSAALEADPSLIEFSAQNRVVMATPTTLIALLRAVEFGWQQMEITKNAQAIYDAGCKIYAKLVGARAHIERLGNSLKSSMDYYNKLVGSVEGRGGVFFHGRQLRELAHSGEELEDLEKVESVVREMESPEWNEPGLSLPAGAIEPLVPE